jgi:signal transduction histidine kinase
METYYQISVKDDGIGLSQEQIEKLFQKFYRADPSGTIKGTGLGLFIVKRIINLHSGGIWVDSTLGKGTCVSFTLPRYYA